MGPVLANKHSGRSQRRVKTGPISFLPCLNVCLYGCMYVYINIFVYVCINIFMHYQDFVLIILKVKKKIYEAKKIKIELSKTDLLSLA